MYRPALQAAFVINRRVTGSVIGREARAALANQGIPALRSDIHQRVIFAESVAVGRVAAELDPCGAAAREITALASEVQGMMR